MSEDYKQANYKGRDRLWEPDDLDDLEYEFDKEDKYVEVPCNVWSIIKKLRIQVKDLQNQIDILKEVKK